jgi:cytochrome c-type biogenesis protein CcmF
LLTAAGVAMVIAILNDDFRLAYVASYSERALPTGYKLAALWAGQEGSLLLWAWLLAALASLAVALRRKDEPQHQAPAVAILAAICAAFAAMLLLAANPFQLGRVVQADGEGLNPMLQNPAMVAHPPMLFLGYAALAVPMALFLAWLISGRRDAAWLASARRWAVAAWLFLTVGILLGAQWAYVELGWGGYWAWDPVENASLLPWLTATALLHCLIAQQRRGMLRAWAAGLAVSSFLLCIFGTYLTRSGVVASVHSFPQSPIGWFFLAMLAVGTAGSAGVLVWRRALLKSDRRIEGLLSREGAFLAASALLIVMMLATLAGTIFPVLAKPFTHRPVTVGPEFYNIVVLPMGLALAALMALGPLLGIVPAAQAANAAARPGRRFFLATVAAVHMAVLAGFMGAWSPWMMCCSAVAGFAVVAIGQDLVRAVVARARSAGEGWAAAAAAVLGGQSRRYAAQLVHLGMVMLVMGVAGSSLYSHKADMSLAPGQSGQIGRYTIRLDGLDETRGPNYVAAEARLVLLGPGGKQTPLRPQRRRYDKSEQNNTKVALRSTLREDVYVTLAGWKDGGKIARIEVIVNPLVNWIWIGGIVMAAGSLLCLLRRRGLETAAAAEATHVALPASPAPPRRAATAPRPGGATETEI